jgi:hypothetical protein
MEVPAANRRNHQARTELDHVYRPDGTLEYVGVRLVRRAGERFANVSVFESFAKKMRSEVYRNIRIQLPGWTDYRIRQRLRMSLIMYNRNNEGRTTTYNHLKMSDIHGDTMLDMFERATQEGSETELDVYDVEWKVWVNPASLIEGATQIETTPEQDADAEKMNTAGIVKYMKLKHDDGSIGCAAHAIAIGIDMKERPGRKSRHLDPKFTEFCKTLQESMSFDDPKFATVFELKKFVQVYKHYRLVILRAAIHTPIIYLGT